MRKMLFGCLVALLAAGCATAKPVVKPTDKIVVQVDKIEERDQNLTGLKAVAFVTLRNNNAEPVTVSGAHYEVVMRQLIKGKGDVALAQTIPAGDTVTVEILAPMQYASSAEEAVAMTEHTLEYAVRGTIAVAGGNVEFAKASAVRTPRLPTISLFTIEAINGKASGLTVNASVEVVNPNPFPLPIKGINWKLVVGGKDFGSGVIAKKAILKPASTTSYELTSNKDPGELKTLAMKLGQSITYALQGALDVEGPPIALNANGDTRILRDE